MPQLRIVDTSALLAWPPEVLSGCVVVASQKGELETLSEQRTLLIESVELDWRIPHHSMIESARTAATDSGDLPRLSSVDIDLIALSIAIENSVLYTDDYRIQNTLSRAGLEWRPVGQQGITDEWSWVLRCSGCGKESKAEGKKTGTCSHCGSPQSLKRKRG